jgi:hypothetical protein
MKPRIWFAATVVAATAPIFAQPPVAAPTTAVMVRLTVKPDVDRPQLMKVMPDEIRATVSFISMGRFSSGIR